MNGARGRVGLVFFEHRIDCVPSPRQCATEWKGRGRP